jgi:membrane protease subunit (stomatin/prohibitin family)
MALFSREFIAVPDDRKNQLVFKWPDVSIRRFTRAIVNADEVALFVNTGQIVQTMGPGRHQIDAQELPGLGAFIDALSGGNAYRAELYFVSTREHTSITFGGRIDDVQDPQSGLIVTLRVFGDYSLRVVDPIALILNLVSTVDVTDNERVTNWVSDQLLKVMRTDITTQIVRNGWPILGLSAYSPEIERAVIGSANAQLATYGVALTRMGNFDINLSPEDATQLKTLSKDTSYSRLAGGFNQYAAGQMALGAGQGMAKGGEAVGGAFLAAGLGMGGLAGQQQYQQQPYQGQVPPAGNGYVGPQPGGPQTGGQPALGQGQYQQPPQQQGPPQGTPPQGTPQPGPACGQCQTPNPAGAKFCMGCGQPLAAAAPHCTNCGTELPAGSRFCGSCGTPAG